MCDQSLLGQVICGDAVPPDGHRRSGGNPRQQGGLSSACGRDYHVKSGWWPFDKWLLESLSGKPRDLWHAELLAQDDEVSHLSVAICRRTTSATSVATWSVVNTCGVSDPSIRPPIARIRIIWPGRYATYEYRTTRFLDLART